MANLILDKSHQAWKISKKLVSLGYLLEAQGEDYGGVDELEGLGMMLTGLGNELGSVAVELDNMATTAKKAAKDPDAPSE